MANSRTAGPLQAVAMLACLVSTSEARAQDDRLAIGAWGELSGGENTSTGVYIDYALEGLLDETGPMMRAFGSYDRYYYTDFDGARVTGETTEFDILLGGNIDLGSARFTLLVGPALVMDSLSSPTGLDFYNSSLGVRFAAIADVALTEETRVRLAGHYKTTRDDYGLSASLLFPIGSGLTLGPSAQLKGNENYQEIKLGPTLSGVTLADIYLTLSGGVALQEDSETAYVGISTWNGF